MLDMDRLQVVWGAHELLICVVDHRLLCVGLRDLGDVLCEFSGRNSVFEDLIKLFQAPPSHLRNEQENPDCKDDVTGAPLRISISMYHRWQSNSNEYVENGMVFRRSGELTM